MRNITLLCLLIFFASLCTGQPCNVNISGSPCIGSNLTANTTGGALAELKWKTNGYVVYFSDTVGSSTSVSVIAGGHGQGGGFNQFNFPSGGICLDKYGNLYVADKHNSRVMKWAPGASYGVRVAGTGTAGSAPEQLSNPWDVFVDTLGNLYVADYNNNRVQMWAPGATAGVTVAGGHGVGNGPKQLYAPCGIYVDNNGDLYIADTHNYRVQKWKKGAKQGVTVAGGTYGTGMNQLSLPIDIYLDGKKALYVADAASDVGGHRVMKWAKGDTTGTVVAGGNGDGSNADQLSYITSLYVTKDGTIYINDVGNRRLQKWVPGATAGVTVAGGYGMGYNYYQLNYGTGITIDKEGNYLVFDGSVYSVKKIVPFRGVVNQSFTPTYTGTYTVEAKFKNGCTATSNPIAIYSKPQPQIYLTPTGSRGNLCGGGIDTFHADWGDGVTTFTWQIPSSCSIVADKGDSIILNIPAGFVGGKLVSKSSNVCGQGVNDTVRLVGHPIRPSILRGRPSALPNQTNVQFFVDDLGFTYNWTVPTGATITSGQGTPSIMVNWGSQAGIVGVSASSSCGTSEVKERYISLGTNRTARIVLNEQAHEQGLLISPNPAVSSFTFGYAAEIPGIYALTIKDIMGRTVVQQPYTLNKGRYSLHTDVSRLQRGIYIVALMQGETIVAKGKLVKQ